MCVFDCIHAESVFLYELVDLNFFMFCGYLDFLKYEKCVSSASVHVILTSVYTDSSN